MFYFENISFLVHVLSHTVKIVFMPKHFTKHIKCSKNLRIETLDKLNS